MKIRYWFEHYLDKHNYACCMCYDDRIELKTIRNGGISDFYSTRSRTIFIDDIASVVVSEGPKSFWSFQNGIAYIQFHVKGSSEKTPDELVSKEGFQGYKELIDNGAIIITRKNKQAQLESAYKIKEYIESQTKHRLSNSRTRNSNTSSDPYEEIVRYKKLLDQGIITDEEFSAVKRKLLKM